MTVSRLLKSCATPPVNCPDGLHLLGLAQGVLGRPLVGAVHDDTGEADGISLATVFGAAPRGDPSDRAVRTPDPAFHVEVSGLDRLREGRRDDGMVLRDDVMEEVRPSPGGQRLVVAEDRVVASRTPGGVVDEVQVPGAHAGGIEGEQEGLARRIDFAGALGDPAFQRLVGVPEALLRLFPLQDVAAGLILPAPAPKRRRDGARQSLGVDGPFQQHDVAEPLDDRGRTRGAATDLSGRQHDEREVRPGRLGLDPGVEGGRIGLGQGLLGDEGRGRARAQAGDQCRRIRTDGGRRARFGEQLLDNPGVAPARRQDQHPLLDLRRWRHAAGPDVSALPSSIATLPP